MHSDEYLAEKAYWDSHLSSRLDEKSFQHMANTLQSDQRIAGGVGLELGCGEGRLTKMVPGLIGIDYSTFGLKREGDGKLPLICADASRLPFAAGAFDYVVTNSLHHMPYRGVLADVGRVLRPGGVFYCFEPNGWHIINLLSYSKRGKLIVGDRGFFPHELGQALADNGFATEACEYVILNMERIRFLTRVQRAAQMLPVRLFQAWFMLRAVKSK